MGHLRTSRRSPLAPRGVIRALGLAWGALLLSGGAAGQEAPPRAPDADEPLLVLAASSLADALPPLAAVWREAGGATVRFSFDATSRLAPQVVQGAPADVFVSADRRWIEWLRARDGLRPGTETVLATNGLVAVVPAAASFVPRDPAGLADSRIGTLALAGENVPAGRYGRAAVELAGIWPEVRGRVVRGGSARGTLEWVARGEADVGVVYRTDALSEPRVRTAFAFPPESHQEVVYPAAVVAGSGRPEEAAAFLAFARSEEGRAILERAGFGAPAGPAGLANPLGQPAGMGEAPDPASDTGERPWLPDPGSAVLLSLVVALVAAFLGLGPAVALGWLLARREFAGKSLVSTVVLAPLVLPPVVTGFLLLSALGGQSPLGRGLADLGLPVPFTLLGAIVAAFVVGLPLYVVAVRGAFEAVDPRYEEVSWTLGIPPGRTFRRISLPLAVPGIAAGAVLAFARALGEFGATVVLAGNVEGRTRTIALAVYTLLESPGGRRTMWILVGASVALSLAALLGYEALSRRQKRRMEEFRGR